MTKRFIFGCGLLAGVVIGELRMLQKAITIPEMRNACKEHLAHKFTTFVYGEQCDEYLFSTFEDAESTLKFLRALISDYGYATVADLKDVTGCTSESYGDSKIGWTYTSGMFIQPKGNQYILYTPKPKRL